jgi:hypothetical protein
MKNGDFYKHFKGGEYFFSCIALPLEGRTNVEEAGVARYHDNTYDINMYISDGVTFVDSDVPLVIYQSEQHYNSDFVFAREVDIFFGYKDKGSNVMVKSFTLMEK